MTDVPPSPAKRPAPDPQPTRRMAIRGLIIAVLAGLGMGAVLGGVTAVLIHNLPFFTLSWLLIVFGGGGAGAMFLLLRARAVRANAFSTMLALAVGMWAMLRVGSYALQLIAYANAQTAVSVPFMDGLGEARIFMEDFLMQRVGIGGIAGYWEYERFGLTPRTGAASTPGNLLIAAVLECGILLIGPLIGQWVYVRYARMARRRSARPITEKSS